VRTRAEKVNGSNRGSSDFRRETPDTQRSRLPERAQCGDERERLIQDQVTLGKILFAAFLHYAAVNMLRNVKPQASRELPGAAGMFAAGNVIGALSSLVGIGGAAVSIPFMSWRNVKLVEAIGTSAAIGFPIALLCVERLARRSAAADEPGICRLARGRRYRAGEHGSPRRSVRGLRTACRWRRLGASSGCCC
jgi:hypothetical protein